MSISSISARSNAYQSYSVQASTQRGAQPPVEASKAKNITQYPVTATSNKTEITNRNDGKSNKSPEINKQASLGGTIDVTA